MTSDELRDWVKRSGLTQAKAADLLGMSLDGFRKNIRGATPISKQTEIIITLIEMLRDCLLDSKGRNADG